MSVPVSFASKQEEVEILIQERAYDLTGILDDTIIILGLRGTICLKG